MCRTWYVAAGGRDTYATSSHAGTLRLGAAVQADARWRKAEAGRLASGRTTRAASLARRPIRVRHLVITVDACGKKTGRPVAQLIAACSDLETLELDVAYVEGGPRVDETIKALASAIRALPKLHGTFLSGSGEEDSDEPLDTLRCALSYSWYQR